VRNKAPDDSIAIVTFNDAVQVIQRFTEDEGTLLDAIDGLGISGATSLYDAVRESVNLFEGTDLIPNIVLVTDGRDSGSATDEATAISLLADANALLFAIGIESGGPDLGTLERLTSSTGGALLTSAEPADLTEVYADVQTRLRQQYRTTIVSEADGGGPASLTLTIGTQSTDASYTPGARLDSMLQVQPVELPTPGGIEALQSETFLWAGVGLVLLAVAGAVYALGTTVVRDTPKLATVLQPYSDGYGATEEHDDRLATSAILQRAVEMTEDFAERQGLLTRVEDMLERANLPLRAAEALFFYVVAAVLVGIIGGLLAGSTLVFVIVLLLAVLAPPAVINFLASRRQKEFESQLPDMLGLLASTLRSGYSFMQGLEAAANESDEPMRKELQRVVTEARLGMPVEVALENVAERTGSKDFAWATMAIGIQREVGGNLAELLDTVADTMTQRERLRGDIKSLTAEGRVSAIVLGFLPIGIGAAIFVLNPEYITSLFEKTVGLVMLAISGLLMGFGFWWMNKIIDIEV
jgi:tight adherence protein B